MLKKIIVATNNKHKLEEFKKILGPYDIEILSLNDAKIVSDPDETGDTFQDNSLIKAKSVCRFTNEVVISDDSGLCVHALNDFPGVHSSRFMENSSYKEKWVAINKMLENYEDKSAHFQSTLCVMNLGKDPLFFVGKINGIIVPAQGDSGFGYDPIFFVQEKNKTFGEMSSQEKNELSHRGVALKKFLEFLQKNNYVIIK